MVALYAAGRRAPTWTSGVPRPPPRRVVLRSRGSALQDPGEELLRRAQNRLAALCGFQRRSSTSSSVARSWAEWTAQACYRLRVAIAIYERNKFFKVMASTTTRTKRTAQPTNLPRRVLMQDAETQTNAPAQLPTTPRAPVFKAPPSRPTFAAGLHSDTDAPTPRAPAFKAPPARPTIAAGLHSDTDVHIIWF